MTSVGIYIPGDLYPQHTNNVTEVIILFHSHLPSHMKKLDIGDLIFVITMRKFFCSDEVSRVCRGSRKNLMPLKGHFLPFNSLMACIEGSIPVI